MILIHYECVQFVLHCKKVLSTETLEAQFQERIFFNAIFKIEFNLYMKQQHV